MKTTEKMKNYVRTLTNDQQKDLLIKLYKNGYTTVNLKAVFDFTYSQVVDILRKYDIKKCSNPNCDQPFKSWNDFFDNSNSPDKHHKYCKICCSEKQKSNLVKHRKYTKTYYNNHKEEHFERGRKWREENREDYLEYHKQYDLDHSDERREYMKKWQEDNKERNKIRNAEYYQNNKESFQQRKKEWNASNPHKSREYTARRKAIKLQATPSYADQEAIDKIYEQATLLNQTVDHIVPLQGKYVCGFHVEYNLRMLPLSKNSSKNNDFRVGSILDNDIVYSAWKHAVADKAADKEVAFLIE